MNLKKHQSFFKDKRVVITGGTGFIGSFLVHALSELAEETYVVVRKSSDLRRINRSLKNIKLCEVVLEEPDSLWNFFQSHSIDFVFHFAQSSHHDLDSPFNYLKAQNSSLKMLTNILEFARLKGGVKVLHACSSTVYGESALNHEGTFSEKTEKIPKSLRGMVKLSERNLCLHYAKKFNLPVFLGRIFRAYGPDDSQKKLIDKSLINYLNNEPVQLVNDRIKRDYIYIDDVVECFLTMCETDMNPGEEINIGSGKERSANEIIEALNDILDRKIKISSDIHPVSEIDRTHWKADISKANRLLNWEPKTSLHDGLAKCVAFHSLNQQPS